MGFLIRLIIFPFLFVKRILFPMVKGALVVPFKMVGVLLKSSLFIYLIAFVILYVAVQSWTGSSGKRSSEPIGPPPILSKEEDPRTRQKITTLPEIKGQIADGNSKFVKSVLEIMNEQEQITYSREFYYAMQDIPAGTAHLWKTPDGGMFGSITPGKPYKSKRGGYCRSFNEIISYQGQAQRLSGKSCQRTDGQGWCKLRNESTSNCEMGYSPGTMESIRKWGRELF